MFMILLINYTGLLNLSLLLQSMDSLVEIPRNKWCQLRDLYKTSWPEGVVAYCVLDTQIANPALSDIIDFKVYSPEGDITNGMVATIDLFGYHQLLIHPLNNIVKTEDALQNTNAVNWTRGVYVPGATLQVIECLKKLQKSRGINIRYDVVSYKHFLDNETPPFDVSDCPPDSYVAPLKSEHLSLIDETWPYQKVHTYKFFETIMNNGMTYVLYSSKTNKPMAWIAVNVEGHLTHLYTPEPYRRLGYGEFITKYAINDLRRKGRCILAFTVDSNKKSQQMFDKLGFRVIGIDQWIFLHY